MSMQDTISSAIVGQLYARRKTKTDLANYLGLSRRAISNKFNGTTNWDTETLQKTAEFLGMNLFDLLDAAKPIGAFNE